MQDFRFHTLFEPSLAHKGPSFHREAFGVDHVKVKIKETYDHLTKSQKSLARLILKDKKAVVLHTAKELGRLTKTSETTVIRFCYAIGYQGYASLQEDIRNDLLVAKDRDTFNRFENISDTTTNLDEIALTEMNGTSLI